MAFLQEKKVFSKRQTGEKWRRKIVVATLWWVSAVLSNKMSTPARLVEFFISLNLIHPSTSVEIISSKFYFDTHSKFSFAFCTTSR